MNEPRITVVMPAYNAERFIDDAIHSMRRQTLSDWEMIVVNDGSVDATGVIADRHAGEDSRIRVIHQANSGQAAANNRAIPLARSKYIARMDADDFSFPSRLAKLVEALDHDAELTVVGSNVWMCEVGGAHVSRTRLPLTDRAIRSVLFGKQQNCLCNPAIAFRREAWLRAGGERPSFGHAHDLDLTLRIARFGTFGNIEEPLLGYRLHASQVSITRASEQAICAYAAFFAHNFSQTTGREADFVRLARVVQMADMKTDGASDRRARQFIVAHLADTHMRLCLLGARKSAASVRRSVVEIARKHAELRLAALPIMHMLAREVRTTRSWKRSWCRLRQGVGWLSAVLMKWHGKRRAAISRS